MKILILILFFSSFPLWGKSVSVSIDPMGSLIKVFGTSNIQSWQLKAKSFKGSGTFEIDKDEIKKIESFEIEVVASKVLAKSRPMNKKVAKALGVKKHPVIHGTLKEVQVKGSTVTGKILISLHGIKKQLDFKSTLKRDGKKIIVQGIQGLDMTEFGIKPPKTKVLFITAIVDPEVKVDYKFTLIRN
jgi:hypothetical protein